MHTAVTTTSQLSYLLTDHLDKTRRVFYTAWGVASGAFTNTRYTYTGQYSYTATFGLMYTACGSPMPRWYDPALKRFAQADTIIPNPGNPMDFDRYAYVRNNPLKYADPGGHFSKDEIDRYLESIGINNADERARIIARWRDDDEWWKIIGPGGATYGDVVDGTKLMFGIPSGERILLKFTKNDASDTFGISGNAITFDAGDMGVWESKKLTNANYSLVKFQNETSDVIWMRPDSQGLLMYQGGTGFGSDGAEVQWGELISVAGHSAEAFLLGFAGIASLVVPVPDPLSKALAVSSFGVFGNEITQTYNFSCNFSRSIDAANRLYLDQHLSQYTP